METFIPIFFLALFFGSLVVFIVWAMRKAKKRVDIPPILLPEGLEIPTYNVIYGEIFTLFQKKDGLGWPYFVVYNDRLKYKARDHTSVFSSFKTVFRQWVEQEVLYSQIAEVGYKKVWFGNYLVLTFVNGGPKVNVQLNPYNLKRLIEFFQSKKLNLSGAALEFLTKPR